MADTTITTNGNGDKDKEQKKLMRLELAALRQQVRFLELLAAEKKIKAKRMAVQAVHYEKLYKMEQSATDKKQALFSVVEAGLFL